MPLAILKIEKSIFLVIPPLARTIFYKNIFFKKKSIHVFSIKATFKNGENIRVSNSIVDRGITYHIRKILQVF